MKKAFKNLSRFFNSFLTVSALVIVAGVVFLYAWPFNVAEFKEIRLLKPVQAGGTISYDVDYCRYVGKGVDTLTRRFLIPENEELSAIELSSNPNLETIDAVTGCRTTKKPIVLPVEVATPPGKYHLLIQVRYCIFVGRCITVEGESAKFDIGRPSIPNQLSAISEQLRLLREYCDDECENVDAVTNSSVPTVLPEPSLPKVAPMTSGQTQPQAQTEERSPAEEAHDRSLLMPALDGLMGTVETLKKTLGLRE